MTTVPQISANDTRKYRYLKLANELEVLLIEDPTTDKSSACCDVRIGSMADPVNAQGLAHFLEHMLFMGTKDYPEENVYSSFLNNHGGYSNAYTSLENTVYYFDVQNDAFEEALRMFSSFFTCPLFAPDSVHRELKAVDSENEKNLQSDGWRSYQLLKSLANDDHPFSRFATGNLKTLEEGPRNLGLNIRDMVVAFYDQYYSANIMKLVVYGKENLNLLESWVHQMFALVPNKELVSPRYDSKPFQKNIGVQLQVVPIKNVKTLELLFPQPATQHLYLSKPNGYIAHLIGHESGGSILAALKEKGWASGLSSYTAQSLTDFSMFGVDIELTDEGMNHIDDIVACFFTYVGMLCQQGAKDWIQQEIQAIKDMNFRFLSKTDPATYATTLANNMQLYPPQHFVSGSKLVFDLDTSHIASLLEDFRPQNCILAVKSKAFSGKTSLKEFHYGTEYNLEPFTANQLDSWNQCLHFLANEWSPVLSLPVPNPFVATNFDLKSVGAAAAAAAISTEYQEEQDESLLQELPKLIAKKSIELPIVPEEPDQVEIVGAVADEEIHMEEVAAAAAAAAENVDANTAEPNCDECDEDEEESVHAVDEGHVKESNDFEKIEETAKAYTLWFKQDSFWKVPKMSVTIMLETLEACNSPSNVALTDLLCSCLKEILNEFAYYADCAGLHYGMSLAKGGLELSFSGYNEKLSELVFKVGDELKKIGTLGSSCPVDIYDRCRQKLIRQYLNFKYSAPYSIALVGTSTCLEDPRWNDLEKYNALLPITFLEFQVFCMKFVRHLRVEALIHGNATPTEATELISTFTSRIGCQPLPISQLPSRRVAALESGVDYVYRQHGSRFNPNEANSSIENVYIIGDMQQFDVAISSDSASKLYQEAILTFLAHILSEPAFDQLRTKEQLGYIVHTAVKKYGTVIALHIIVQSSHKNPEYLNKRIEEFLQEYFTNQLSAFTEEMFQTNVHAVLELLVEKPKNIYEENNRLFTEIKTGTYLFDRKKRLADIVSSLKLGEIIDFMKSYVLPGPNRKKFSSQLFAAAHCYSRANQEDVAKKVQLILDAASFRRTMFLQPIERMDIASLM